VEVRDIVVPRELQPAMAAGAIAARERDARMTLAEAEADISDMLKDASANYEGDPEAMRLRTMHLAYESVKQSGGTLVIPSAFSEGFTDPDAAEAVAKSERTDVAAISSYNCVELWRFNDKACYNGPRLENWV